MNKPAELEIWNLAGNQTANHLFIGSNDMMRQIYMVCVEKIKKNLKTTVEEFREKHF